MAVAVRPTAARSPVGRPRSGGGPASARRPILGRIVAVVALRAGWCNADIAAAWRELGIDAALLAPATAARRIRPGDVVLNRLDVRPSLDGGEPGLAAVEALGRIGARILNRPSALVAAHDNHAAARPETALRIVGSRRDALPTAGEVDAGWHMPAAGRGFRCHGAIAQRYAPHTADLRLVIAGGRLVGAVERHPAHGEQASI